MKWSFRLATIFGIDLKVHFTFFLVLAVGAAQWSGYGVTGMAFGVGAMLLLFACVTLHEFGHALTAGRFGVPVREIILLPIGGVAVLGRNPDKPLHELLIALAGPAVNVAIAAVLVAVIGAGRAAGLLDPHALLNGRVEPSLDLMLGFLFSANVMLVVFNMIPAFPLDGGRVLRAVLGFKMPWAKATRVAAGVGQLAAIGLAVWGLTHGDVLLAVIAFFIFTGAGAESAAARAGTVLATRRVGDAYNKFALTLSMDDRVGKVIEHLLTSYQPDFAVLHRGKLQGVVTRNDVLAWLAEHQGTYDVYVTEVMQDAPDVLRVDARLSLDEVVQAMQSAESRIAAVFDADLFLGLVSAEDIAEAQAVLSFLGRRAATGLHHPERAWPLPQRGAV